MQLEIFALATIGILILRDKTKQDYLSALKCHVFPKLGDHEMKSITKKDIQEVVQDLDPPIAAKTLAVLKTVF